LLEQNRECINDKLKSPWGRSYARRDTTCPE
jgi:hypothetical protein